MLGGCSVWRGVPLSLRGWGIVPHTHTHTPLTPPPSQWCPCSYKVFVFLIGLHESEAKHDRDNDNYGTEYNWRGQKENSEEELDPTTDYKLFKLLQQLFTDRRHSDTTWINISKQRAGFSREHEGYNHTTEGVGFSDTDRLSNLAVLNRIYILNILLQWIFLKSLFVTADKINQQIRMIETKIQTDWAKIYLFLSFFFQAKTNHKNSDMTYWHIEVITREIK